MKRIIVILLATLMLFLAGCGSGNTPVSSEGLGHEPEASDQDVSSQPPDLPEEPAPSVVPETAYYLDPSAFLHGAAPSTDEKDDAGFIEQIFILEKGYGPLGKQYVDALLEGPYELTLISSHETDKEDALYENYYLAYNGAARVGRYKMKETCQIYVGVDNYKNKDEAHIRVLVAAGFTSKDDGERADLSHFITLNPSDKLSQEPASTSAPTPKPTATTTPAPKPTATPAPSGPSSSTLLPDLTIFLNRSPSKSGNYYDGKQFLFQAMPYSAVDTVVNEVLALLQESRYQLQLVNNYRKNVTDNTYTIRYDLKYTGTSDEIDLLTNKNETSWYNVQVSVTHYTKAQEFNLRIHFGNGFQLEDPGVRVSANVSKGGGGGSGGGSSGGGGYDPYVPDHSKLQCLTCRGDGDCNTCGGDGYTGFGDAKAGCRSCHGDGDCNTCGGSGTR